MDYRASFEQLVTSFGSEKAKRAHAANARNRVESSALEGALATAVTHVQTEVEKARGGCFNQGMHCHLLELNGHLTVVVNNFSCENTYF